VPRRLLVAALLAADLLAWHFLGPTTTTAVWANNVVLAGVVCGVALLWSQAGMTIGHLGALCGGLVVYDVTVTSVLGDMGPLLDTLAAAIPAGVFQTTGGAAQLGLGDVLVATLVPAVFARERGHRWGLAAWLVTQLALALAYLAAAHRVLGAEFPVLVVLGPAVVALCVAAAVRRWSGPSVPSVPSVPSAPSVPSVRDIMST
jgi:hypothetical protein